MNHRIIKASTHSIALSFSSQSGETESSSETPSPQSDSSSSSDASPPSPVAPPKDVDEILASSDLEIPDRDTGGYASLEMEGPQKHNEL